MEVERLKDSELVERTLGGCAQSYEALFERYRDSLLVMLRLYNSDCDLCDDIVQEAFIKAYLNLDRYNPDYNFGGWIVKIARNLLIDYTRRVENRAKESTEEIDIASREPNPEERFMRSEDSSRITRALDRLPDGYRQIIELRFRRDMSYEQISVELGMPMGTVKTQIFRARRAFIEILG